MATWSIEHIPANGGASTFASLGVWGFASLQMQFVNWGIDQAAVTTRGGSIAFEAAQFAYLDKLVVWRNGTRFAHFWVTGLGATADAHESRTYTLSGPSWWLSNLPFRWPYWPVKSTIESSDKTASMWLQYALMSAISLGAPIAHESGSTGYEQFSAPAGDLSASRTCMEVVQRAARVHPMSSGTWDMAGETPSFIVRTRSNLAAQSIAVSDSIETFGLTPNHEIQAKGVHIMYVYGDDATVGADDVAGESPYLSGPNTLEIIVQVADADAAWHANFLGIAAKLYEGLGPLVWTGALNFHEVDTADIPLVRPGASVNLTGGLAEWSTMAACAQSVAWSVGPNTNDLCTVTFGAPEQLGVQDLLDFAAAGYTSAACAGGNPSPYEPPTPPTINPGDPGTYDDLNGGTGGGTPEGIIAVQTRGGNWSLAGYSSFDGSAPSRRWLRVDMAYSVTYDCGYGPNTSTGSAYGVYDPANFAAGAHGENLALLNGWSAEQYFCSAPSPYVKSVTTATATATPGTYVSIGSCCGSQNPYTLVSGSDVHTLSSEDTADDAIARLLAGSPEWTDGLTAIRTIPTSGITGVYREIRYRTEHAETAGQQVWVEGQWVAGAWVPGYYRTASTSTTYPTLTGLSPWGRYCVTVPLESRPVDEAGAPTGDGTWSEAGTRQHYFVADIEGVGGFDWQIIEPTAGYETRIGTPLVEVA